MSRRCWTELNSFSVYVSISVVHFWFICHSLSTIACFEHLFIISSHLLSSPFLSSPSFSIFCRCINNLNCIWIKPFIKLGQQRPLLLLLINYKLKRNHHFIVWIKRQLRVLVNTLLENSDRTLTTWINTLRVHNISRIYLFLRSLLQKARNCKHFSLRCPFSSYFLNLVI